MSSGLIVEFLWITGHFNRAAAYGHLTSDIWHAQLYHGGGKIQNAALSRRSMVNHFWTVEDYRQQAVEVRPGKFILKNQHMFVSPVFVDRPQPQNGKS